MKQLFFLMLVALELVACKQPTDNTKALQNRIDSLEKKLADAYKPGFGEFMSGIQAHHAKLWFAGQNQNWKLADFEVHEMMEAFDGIQKYQSERKESTMINMIMPTLDSVNTAISQKNPALFKSSFSMLTTTCNNCHRLAEFEFNVVKIPESSQFSNQDFKTNK